MPRCSGDDLNSVRFVLSLSWSGAALPAWLARAGASGDKPRSALLPARFRRAADFAGRAGSRERTQFDVVDSFASL